MELEMQKDVYKDMGQYLVREDLQLEYRIFRVTIESESVGKFGKINVFIFIFFFHGNMQNKLVGSLMGHVVKLNAGLALLMMFP